ncbi:MAG TPA: aldehyde dehydrogenase family protein [Fontimonas sp.]
MNYGKLLIDGQDIEAANGARFDVLAPATEAVFGTAARATAADVDLAVAAARRGFATWSRLAPKEREARLLKAADLLEQRGEATMLDTLIDESGSTITKARFEIRYSVDLLRTAAGEARRLYGDTFPNDSPLRLSMVFREPVGVVAVVSPYNAPLALLVKMVAFPLAAGNAVVIKPSEETPLIALAFARLLLDAGVPAAAVNVVTGYGAECGAPLVAHRGIDGIALTGSTATGKAIGAQAMQRMLRAQLELGGKSALLVLRDVDIEKAARVAAAGMFNHAGQICMANSRIVVEQPIHEDFLVAFKTACEALPLGELRDPATAYGPLINRRALEKIEKHQNDAIADGATLLTGGRAVRGLTYAPTVLLGTQRSSTAWCEESFGPLTSVVPAADLDEAIAIANDSDYGLSAAVLTRDFQWGFRAAREIRSGAVHIGMHAFQSNALAPVGGTGLSGLGRSGGRYSIEEFTELKWVSLELGDAP